MENKVPEFIRLHKADTNTTVIVATKDIVYISTGDNEKKDAMVVLRDTRVEPFYVNETPDKIYKVLNIS